MARRFGRLGSGLVVLCVSAWLLSGAWLERSGSAAAPGDGPAATVAGEICEQAAGGSAGRAALADSLRRAAKRSGGRGLPASVVDELIRLDPLVAAETLAQMSVHRGSLDDDLAARAARLLEHDDPFVRGLAAWAIQARITRDNSGRNWSDRVWPRENPPDWFGAWDRFPAERLVEVDYVCQAAVREMHRDAEKLIGDGAAILRRAEAVAQQVRERGSEAQQAKLGPAVEAVRDAKAQLDACKSGETARAAWLALRKAAREVVMMSPAIDFDRLMLVTWHDLHLGTNINNGGFPRRQKPGGDLWIKDGLDPEAAMTPMLDGRLGNGSIRGYDLGWDANKVVFSWSRQEIDPDAPGGFSSEAMHLWEMHVDGRQLTQLTDHPAQSDLEPCYLPDGGIAFVSDRSNFGNQCSGPFIQDKRCLNLWRLDADRETMTSLSNNKDFDRHPRVLADGRLIFTHWEYQERNFYLLHTLWASRPDGTAADAFFEQHMNDPGSLRDARQVPGSHLLTATTQGHHAYDQGPIVLIDPQVGVNDVGGLRTVTPGAFAKEGGPVGGTVDQGGVPRDLVGTYQHVSPLSETTFLASFTYDRRFRGWGVYVVDVWGNQELVHRDKMLSAVMPNPLAPRPKPPVLADTVRPEQDRATTYVQNVYHDLPGVEPGTVKYIRIVQRLAQPTPVYARRTGEASREDEVDYHFNHIHYLPGASYTVHFGYWTWGPSRVIGTVPVEEDGSAHFEVPVGTPVFFQALDEHRREVRRMRSSVTFQRGETRGCVGCHETRGTAPSPAPGNVLTAIRRGPDRPDPPKWGDTTGLEFEEHIQPIFDRNCASCHGQEDPAGGLEFTARKVSGFNQSYRTLFGLSPDEPTPVHHVTIHEMLHPDSDPDTLYPSKPDGVHGRTSRPARRVIEKMMEGAWPGMLVSVSNHHSKADITMPYEFGSTQSRLVTTLLDDPEHQEVRGQMTGDEWRMLMTWIDVNAPYTSRFIDKWPYKQTGGRTAPVFLELELPSPWRPADDGACFTGELVEYEPPALK